MEVRDEPADVRREHDQPTRDAPTGITGDPSIVHMLEEVTEESNQPVNEVLDSVSFAHFKFLFGYGT